MTIQKRVYLVAARLKGGVQKAVFVASRDEARRQVDRFKAIGAEMTVMALLRNTNAQPAR